MYEPVHGSAPDIAGQNVANPLATILSLSMLLRYSLREEKLADKLDVSYEKMPNNVVENFGNANSVTIPTAISYNLGKKLLNETFLIYMAGFGVGLSWASLILTLEKLTFCEIINYK